MNLRGHAVFFEGLAFLTLQGSLQIHQRCDLALGVLINPTIVNQADGTVLRKCSFSRPDRRVTINPGLLQHPQVLHDTKPGHRQFGLELTQRLTVASEKQVEQKPPRRISERLKTGSSLNMCEL